MSEEVWDEIYALRNRVTKLEQRVKEFEGQTFEAVQAKAKAQAEALEADFWDCLSRLGE